MLEFVGVLIAPPLWSRTCTNRVLPKTCSSLFKSVEDLTQPMPRMAADAVVTANALVNAPTKIRLHLCIIVLIRRSND